MGRGAGKVSGQAQLAAHRAHAENNQICCLIFRDFQNSLRRRGELPAEFEQAFRMTPGLGLSWHQFLEASYHVRLDSLQVRDAGGGLLNYME
jgi:hypothetical protein